MELPEELRTALAAELQTVRPRQLVDASRNLSHRYRGRTGRDAKDSLISSADVPAYIAYRLPATFAAVAAVLREVRDRRPDLSPKRLLDVGGGPGTAAWAAVTVWPELERISILERNADMIRIGQRLAAGSDSRAIREAVWRSIDIASIWNEEPADLVTAGYVIGELPDCARDEAVQRLWDHADDVCIVVEPGTPQGADLIRVATHRLTSRGADILAPFPRDWHCRESEHDWCHFAERLPRTRIHRTAKEATLAYEDEKYAYVAGSRHAGIPIAARVLRHPQARSGHLRLVLCTAEGVRHIVVPRSHREAYRRAKELRWGSAIPLDDADLYGLCG